MLFVDYLYEVEENVAIILMADVKKFHFFSFELFYIVLTANEDEIEKRIRKRGDLDMIERAKFLKRELDSMAENIGHLYDNTNKDIDEMVEEIVLDKFKL
nr:hypothetical protein [uncultured Butyrivibrio sp.]